MDDVGVKNNIIVSKDWVKNTISSNTSLNNAVHNNAVHKILASDHAFHN